jgi:hypothetical protein
MALSPHYSWPEPNDSDFVKNGADAMRDLGDAADATVYGIDGRVTTAEAAIVTLQAQVNDLIHPFLLMGA